MSSSVPWPASSIGTRSGRPHIVEYSLLLISMQSALTVATEDSAVRPMNEFFKNISDDDDIRQGDIIRMIHPASPPIVTYGVVVTADCDIAQKKAGERYSWLEVLSMNDYVDGPWAEEQLRKLAEKQGKALCEHLNAQLRKLDSNLSPLTAKTLAEWLESCSAEEILQAISGATPKPEQKVLRDLKGLAMALGVGDEQSPFGRLKSSWSLLGTDTAKQREAVRSAFKTSGGFQDYFVVPELPRTSGYGFVVMLRSMSTIMAADLFLTEQDARIQDRPNAFHRLGRLHDGIRFAIAQRLAFLFSRIGLPSAFESACEASTDMMADELFPSNSKKASA